MEDVNASKLKSDEMAKQEATLKRQEETTRRINEKINNKNKANAIREENKAAKERIKLEERVTKEAKGLKAILGEISQYKIDIFGKSNSNIAKQSQALKEASKEAKKAQEEIKKINEEVSKSKRQMRELEVYKTKTFNKLDNAHFKGNLQTGEYLRLSKLTRELNAETENLSTAQKEISAHIQVAIDNKKISML